MSSIDKVGEERKMTKKVVPAIIISFFIGVLTLCVFISLTNGRFLGILPGVSYGDGLSNGSVPIGASKAELVAAAYEILGYIKNSEYDNLGEISHPETGVLFSPYATISEQTARVFTAAEIKAISGDKQTYVWGVYDGTGEPIEMTPVDYFNRFVFDRDFTRAKLIGVDQVVRSGNSLENISDIFPEMRYVDFHLPSSDNSDLSWSSLRLGFAPYGDSLMLSLVLHSENTI